jgi:hypothetical protein
VPDTKNVVVHFTGSASAGSTKGVIVHFGPVITAGDFIADIGFRYPIHKLALSIQHVREITIEFRFPKPRYEHDIVYDNNVYRPGIANFWGFKHDLGNYIGDNRKTAGWVDSLRTQRPTKDIPWELGALLNPTKDGLWSDADRSPRKDSRIPWALGQSVADDWQAHHHEGRKERPYGINVEWDKAAPLSVHLSAQPWHGNLPSRKVAKEAPWRVGAALLKLLRHQWDKGRWLTAKDPGVLLGGHKIPWREARYPYPGISAPPPGPPGPPPPVPPRSTKGVLIEFICPWVDYGLTDIPIHFDSIPCPEAGVGLIIPIRRLYMILNQISMKVVGSNEPIQLFSCSLSTDQNSWAWSMQANIAAKHLYLVEPTPSGPVEVQININGVKWNFLVESYDRRRTFGDTQVTLKGRSITAELDAPYAPVRNYASDQSYYSKQLVEAELALMPGTWALDWPTAGDPVVSRRWEADDGLNLGWQVPQGVHTYSGKTPMQAINELIGSVGGYVQSHNELPKLIVSSSYPVPPWDWATTSAELSIPKSIILADSLQWMEKPAYNRVYVTGEREGVNALVRNTDITPDLQAPQYVNRYMTDQYAAREKGKNIISEGGKQALVSINVPLDPTINLGLITPGKLVVITDPTAEETAWKGLTRSITLTASAADREITVTQAVGIERHY